MNPATDETTGELGNLRPSIGGDEFAVRWGRLGWTKVAGSWVVRVPNDAGVRPGDTLEVWSARRGETGKVVVESLGPTFVANGVTWRNARPVARTSARKQRHGQSWNQSYGQTWKQRYGRCEDAPCCGCCS